VTHREYRTGLVLAAAAASVGTLSYTVGCPLSSMGLPAVIAARSL